jgi:hypothetical protein
LYNATAIEARAQLTKIIKRDAVGEDATVVFLGHSFDVISSFPSGSQETQ